MNGHAQLTLAHTANGSLRRTYFPVNAKMTMVVQLISSIAFEFNLPCSHNSNILGADKCIEYFGHHPDLIPCTMLFSLSLAVKDPRLPLLLPDKKWVARSDGWGHWRLNVTGCLSALPEINLSIPWIAQYSYYNYYCASEQLHLLLSRKPFIKIHSIEQNDPPF